jgi:hypothetical protein
MRVLYFNIHGRYNKEFFSPCSANMQILISLQNLNSLNLL